MRLPLLPLLLPLPLLISTAQLQPSWLPVQPQAAHWSLPLTLHGKPLLALLQLPLLLVLLQAEPGALTQKAVSSREEPLCRDELQLLAHLGGSSPE